MEAKWRLCCVYEWELLPEGLLARLVVRLQRRARVVDAWTDCVVVGDTESTSISLCQITAERSKRQLRIESNGGAQQGALVQLVRQECASLVAAACVRHEIPPWRLQVACPHCAPSAQPALLDVGRCVASVLGDDATYECGSERVPASLLLHALSADAVPVLDAASLREEPSSSSSDAFASRPALLGGQPVLLRELCPASKRGPPPSALLSEMVHEAWPAFRQEVARLRALPSHPNVARVLGLLLAPPRLVMEHTPGSVDLMTALQSHLIWQGASPAATSSTPALCLRIALDLARGLHFLHTQQPPVTNVELCCSNVVLTLDGSMTCAKLTDLGLSRQLERLRDVQGEGCEFVAPEAEFGEPHRAQPWVDAYAYALVVNAVMAEQMPFADLAGKVREPCVLLLSPQNRAHKHRCMLQTGAAASPWRGCVLPFQRTCRRGCDSSWRNCGSPIRLCGRQCRAWCSVWSSRGAASSRALPLRQLACCRRGEVLCARCSSRRTAACRACAAEAAAARCLWACGRACCFRLRCRTIRA